MAINAATIYEFRATNGDSTNGGGFANLDDGTSVDYSNQDAAQLSLTDLAMTTGGTTLTSATGGFTAAMVGNVIQIASGTNFTAGFYQVTAYTDTNTVTIDRDATDGSNGTDGVGKLGGALDILTDAFLENTTHLVAGNIIYIKNDGTMTLTGGIDVARDGTAALPIVIKGYNSTRGDKPTGTNRPLIACAANAFTFDRDWTFMNLRITTTNALGFVSNVGCIITNCHVNNTSGSAGRRAFLFGYANGYGKMFGCEAQSVNGRGIQSASNSQLVSCYVHDCDDGINFNNSTNNMVIGSVIDTIATNGINIGSGVQNQLHGNTIYNCTTGITGSSSWSAFTNNIIDSCTTGASWTSEVKDNYWDFNCWNNTTDVTNVTKGDNAVTGDPLFTAAASGDFSLGTGSPALNAGLMYNTWTSAT